MRNRLSRLHIRLLVLILVSALPAFAIIAYSSAEQHAKAVQDAHGRALAAARIGAGHHRGLIVHSHQQLANLALLGLATALMLCLGWWASRRLVLRPVEALSEAARRLGGGDLAFGIEALRTRAARANAEQTLADSEAKLERVLSSIDNLVWSLAVPRGQLLYVNAAAQRILGHPPEDFYRRPETWLEMVHPEDRALALAPYRGGVAGDTVQREYRIVRPDGEIRWLDSRLRLVRDAEGQLLHIDGVAADITGRKQHEHKIEYLATRDALTALPNRSLLVDRIEQALAHAGHTQRTLAVVVLNLDRLKFINDSLGHGTGDRLLVAVAQRLRETVRGGDTVARLGGDEFAILLDDLRQPEDALAPTVKVHDALARSFLIDGRELRLTVSLGAAVYPADGDSAELLQQHAHAAMHRAKAGGGDGLQFYEKQMSDEVQEKVRLEQALRAALLSGEGLELHYQPQVDLASGRVCGAEALARWRHPELGMVSPARFIPLAEETGLIVAMTEWALRTACTQMLAWRRAGLALERVAVNLSARHFWQGDAVEMVMRILAETGLPACHLELEITESVAMRSIEDTVDALKELRALGVTVSLDDFGTGYSSLSYLRRLPIDKIKIDQSFIRELTSHPDASLLVQQIIHIAHAMQCLAIAEGVETQAVADFLHQQGCDGAQGWHFSRPLPAQALAEWMAQAANSVYSPNAACHPRVSGGSFSTPPCVGGRISRQVWLDLGLYPSPGSVFPKDRPGPERGRLRRLIALRNWAWFAG